MRVSEVMTPGVRVVSPDQTISEAARRREGPAPARFGDLAKGDNAASAGQAVADVTAPGGSHSQRSGSRRKNAKRV